MIKKDRRAIGQTNTFRAMQVYRAVCDSVRAGRQGVITIPNGA